MIPLVFPGLKPWGNVGQNSKEDKYLRNVTPTTISLPSIAIETKLVIG